MAQPGREASGGIEDPLPMQAGRRRLESVLRARGAVFVRGGPSADLRAWTPSGMRLVEIGVSSLLAGEIAGWILAEIGEPLDGPVESRLLAVLRERSYPLRVLLNDAGGLPAAQWRRLEHLAREARGRLEIVAHDPAPFEASAPAGPAPVPEDPRVSAPLVSEATSPPTRPEPPGSAEAWLPAEALRALGQLVGALRAGATSVALAGPAGAGKTVVLRALARRLPPEFDPVFVPSMALEEEEFLRWMLHCRGGRSPGSDVRDAWSRELDRAHDRGTPLVLLIDDAGSLPPALAESLAAWATARGGDLRLVLGLCDDGGYRLPPLVGLKRVRLLGTLARGEARRMLTRRDGEPNSEASSPAHDAERSKTPLPAEVFREAALQRLRTSRAPEPLASHPTRVLRPLGERPRTPPHRAPARLGAVRRGRRLRRIVALLAVLSMGLLFSGATPQDAGPEHKHPDAMTLRIDAAPGTRILVDGREVGTAPLGPLLIARGQHRIRAELADGRVIERKIVIDAQPRRFQIHP